jgi:thiol:disulfide interchange protein DsbD
MVNRVLRITLGLLAMFMSLAAYAVNESDLLPPDEAFPLTVSVSGPQQVTLNFGTKPGYYLYRDRFSFAVDGMPVKPDQMPVAEAKNDPTFGMVQVYHRPVQLHIPLSRVITSGIVLAVTSQGCADLGGVLSAADTKLPNSCRRRYHQHAS